MTDKSHFTTVNNSINKLGYNVLTTISHNLVATRNASIMKQE